MNRLFPFPTTLKIRTWLFLAAASVLLPMVAFLGLLLQHIERDQQALVDAEVRYRMDHLVQEVDERIKLSVQALEVLSASDSARKGDWAALYRSAIHLVGTHPHYLAVSLVDAHKQLVFLTTLPFGQATFGTHYPDLVDEVLQSGMPNVSGPFRVPVAEGHRLAVSVPIVQGHRVTHVLRMILSTDSIDRLLHQQQLPEGWIVSIGDRHGTVVARSVRSETYVGKTGSATYVAALRRNDGQVFKGLTLDGVPTSGLVAPVFGGYWFAGMAVPDVVLQKRYRETMLFMGFLSLAMVLLGSGVALGISLFFARQTRALETVVGSGRAHTPLPWPLRMTELRQVYLRYRDARLQQDCAERNLLLATDEKNAVRDLYEHAPCGYHSLDPGGVVVRINQTELNWLGRTREAVLGRPFADFVAPAGRERLQDNFARFLVEGRIENIDLELLRADRSTLPVVVNATLIHDAEGRPLMSRSTVFDITERKKLEKRLEDMSHQDALTGLSNRRHFYPLAATAFERVRRTGGLLALAMLDVDHFKQVNDRYGHATGDAVLKALAHTCRESLRSTDTVARLGGEEFVLLLPCTTLDDALARLEGLRERLASTRLGGAEPPDLGFTVSIGVTLLGHAADSVDAVLARADAALYEAKRLGRNQVRVG
ncbi:MAG: diguanylate cyclase [Burkholderiaceae bacterium]|nr:diguanylate cyclase [Burkholderiaceae bacterium]